MAEVLFNVAAGIVLSLGSTAVNEIGQCWGVSDELDKLKRTVSTIEAVLLHAEELSDHNPQLKHWLGLLSDALYDADDLLDDFSTEALRQQVMPGSKLAKKVRLFFSSSNQFVLGLKMGHKVRALRERLDEIASEKNKFHLEECFGGERSLMPKGRYQTHSSPPQVVIGREQEKEEIVRILLSSDCDENVSVVSIVGIGGLGKTTLTQMVYDDVDVEDHFELKIWVRVSDDFDVQLLVKKTLESAYRDSVNITEMDPLRNRLHQKINGRKYLLVLDDMWNNDVNKWSSFIDLLAGGARGSKIVITTRLRTVAEMSRPISIHELRHLSENESWSLFEQVAFKQGKLPNPSLEATGKEIIAKCCGVPLAIKTIGGVLYFKDSNSEWESFKDNELSKIQPFENDISPILRLSYNHLPSEYKPCFAFCSLYPRDFRIRVDELVQLWKAEGYVRPRNPNECVQEVGYEYFMDLYRLSFFQDVERGDLGNIKVCKMHDLMHDLAISVAGDNFCTSHSGMTSINDKTRHMSFQAGGSYMMQDFTSLLRAKKIRTVLPLCKYREFEANMEAKIDSMFRNLRCLRVLNLSHMKINTLSNSIYKLKHLRYLNLSGNNAMKKLPNSITDLLNLQVLEIGGCYNLMQLPDNITKLVNLTDLNNYGCVGLSHMPLGIGKLTKLEKLRLFVIAKDGSTSKRSGGLDELHSLNKLRGELKIKNLRYVKNAESAFKAGILNEKKHLQSLNLDWGKLADENYANDAASEEMGMEALCPHPNLKQLEVWYYRGVKPPSWLPSITNLVSISFWNCGNTQWLPPFDQLPYLKELRVFGMTKLEHIDVEIGGGSSSFFPSLTFLRLEECPYLKGFERQSSLSPGKLLCFPCLSELVIECCPNLTYLPLFSELKKLNMDGGGIKSLMKIVKMPTKSFSTLSHLQDLQILNVDESLEDDELLQCLPSLQHLMFFDCGLKSVFRYEMEDGMQWRSLNVLRSVQFRYVRYLEALPEGLQYVTSLQYMTIYSCPSLACIPEWMPKLITLQDFHIYFCPQLEARCNDNSAEDWPYISHIPNIIIDGKPIQKYGRYLL